MLATGLLAFLQADSASVAPPVPPRFSILVDPCARVSSDPSARDVVVCGRRAEGSPRLPLPGERGPPDHPIPVNPDATGMGALAAQGAPCGAVQGGCPGGIKIPPQLVSAVVDTVGGALKDRKWRTARRRDGAARIPIDLAEAPPPASAQNVQP